MNVTTTQGRCLNEDMYALLAAAIDNTMIIISLSPRSFSSRLFRLGNFDRYAICDDHDVTDDWYLDGAWCQCVLVYALFQAWGNTLE